MEDPSKPAGDSASLSIIIPCYNEAENIPALAASLFPVVEQLAQYRTVQVVLVDDGSRDGTGRQLEQLANGHSQVQVVHHPENRGVGAAIRTGFEHAKGQVIVTTDSDGTYPFDEIPLILGRLVPGVDLVIASPYHPQGRVAGVAPYRFVLSQGASWIYRLLLDCHIHTYTALFRAYRRDIVEQVPSTADGFLMPAEFLANAILMGYRVAEFPTVLNVRRHGQSKARVLRIILAHLRFQARLLWRRGRRQTPVPASDAREQAK